MTSIKNELNKDTALTEIRLLLANPKNTYVILVEGKSDFKFLNNILHDVYICESYDGKKSLLEISKKFINEKFLAICDKDYLENYSDNIITYDYCSLETMLFSNEDILKSFLDDIEYNQQLYNELYSETIRVVSYIGLIRKYNFLNQLNFSFDKLSPSSYYKEDNTFDEIIRKIECTNNKIKIDISEIEKLQKNCKSLEDKLNVMQGHDLTRFIKFYTQTRTDYKFFESLLYSKANLYRLKNSNFIKRLENKIPSIYFNL